MKNQEKCFSKIVITGYLNKSTLTKRVIDKDVMYDGFFNVERLSGSVDILPVTIPECFMPFITNEKCTLVGEVRTYNKLIEGKSKLFVYVFVMDVTNDSTDNNNKVNILGYICKKPIYRKTPLGTDICDVIVCVSHNGKSFYIPVICWGKYAIMAGKLDKGMCVELDGRFQSREYVKVKGEDSKVLTAYEVSAFSIKLI